jgi:MFS family permease
MAMAERLFTHDGLFLLVSTFLNSIPVGYINVVPLVYLAEIGYDPAAIGMIYSASAIATTIGMIPCALLAERCGKKKLLIVGTFLPCVSYAIFGLTLDSSLLTIASIIGGVGFAGGLGAAIATPSLFPMLASSTSDNKRSTLFGILQGAWAVALTIGSVLSFLPSIFTYYFAQGERLAHFESYFLMSGVAAAAIIPILFVKERGSRFDLKTSSGITSPPSRFSRGGMLHHSGRFTFPVTSWFRIAQFSMVLAFTGFGLGVLVQLLPTWFALRYGASESTIGFWMGVSNLAPIVSIPLIPKLVSRKGTISTAAATGFVGAFILALMPFTATFEMAAALFAIRGIAVGVSWAVVQSYMMGVVSENERATMVGFAFTAWGVGVSFGILVGGELLGVGLLAFPFVAAVISYLVSSAALLHFFRKVKPLEEVIRFSMPRISD